MDITEIIKLVLTTLSRYVIVGVSAWLVAHGIFDEGTAATLQSPAAIAAIVAALLAAATGAYVRLKSRFNTNVALNLPKGSTLEQVQTITGNATMKEIVSTQPK